jgi:hypothetical protein
MTITDAVSRVSAIQAETAALRTAFTPPSSTAASQTAPVGATAPSPPATSSTSFANALAQAQGTTSTATAQDVSSSAGVSGGGVPLSAAAQSMLTTGQQQFASRLAADTGLSPQTIAAWLLAEESSGAAQTRQAANNNDWLNIGYTDSGTYGSSDSIWSNPIAAADATAGWLKGQNTIPGYGTASSGVQAILNTAGQSPSAQVAALQSSGWASSGYPSLPSLLAQVGG